MEVQWLRIHPRAHELSAWLGKSTPAAKQLSLCSAVTSPRTVTAEARVPRLRTPRQEKPPQGEACTSQLEKACEQQ